MGETLQEPFLPTRPLPQATSKHDSCIMHYACALSNRVRGNNHMSMHFLTAYVYCMSSSIHSARDAPSKRSSTQPDVRTYTTDLNKTSDCAQHATCTLIDKRRFSFHMGNTPTQQSHWLDHTARSAYSNLLSIAPRGVIMREGTRSRSASMTCSHL